MSAIGNQQSAISNRQRDERARVGGGIARADLSRCNREGLLFAGKPRNFALSLCFLGVPQTRRAAKPKQKFAKRVPDGEFEKANPQCRSPRRPQAFFPATPPAPAGRGCPREE